MKKISLAELTHKNWRRIGGWLLVVLLLTVAAYYGIQAAMVDERTPRKLVVYAFSTQEEVFSQEVFSAFERAWKTETGQDLTIEGIFGPSATLAEQIILGAPADVAVFSNAQHVNWLKMSRMVGLNNQPLMIGCTPIVIVVRPGNPAGIVEFDDLMQPGLCLIHPDPRTSGAGEWGVLAVYGNVYLETQNETAAKDQLKEVWKNVRLLAPSARAALTLFELGACDALITYEQDARLALARGVSLEIVVPAQTILAQPVAVIVDKNVNRAEHTLAQAFIDFLASEDGQMIFTRYQLRTISISSAQFPPLVHSFTVEDLGDWPHAYGDLIESLWKIEIEPRLSLDSEPTLLETGE